MLRSVPPSSGSRSTPSIVTGLPNNPVSSGPIITERLVRGVVIGGCLVPELTVTVMIGGASGGGGI